MKKGRKTMKKIFKRVVCILLATVALGATACQKETYLKDIDAKEIADTLCEKTPTESRWIDNDQSFIKEYITVSEVVKESYVYYAQNTNDLDEFGIFEVEEGKAQEVRNQLLSGYLKKRYDENLEWYNSYMPTETPKLRDAEVRVYGNCVVYAVLSQANRKTFFDECEKLLKSEK
jgi:hypothetical protein